MTTRFCVIHSLFFMISINSRIVLTISGILLVPFFASAIDTGGMPIALQPGIVATDPSMLTPEDGVFDVSVLLVNNASVPRDVRYGATLIPAPENTLATGKEYSVRADDFVRVLPGEKKMIALRVVAPQFLNGPYQLFAQVLDRDGGVPTLLFVDDVLLSGGKEETLFQCKRAGVILDADMSLSLKPDEVLGDIACALIGREGMERSVISVELFRGGIFGPRVAVATAETGMVRESG